MKAKPFNFEDVFAKDFTKEVNKAIKVINELGVKMFEELSNDDVISKREQCLNTAKECVCKDRNNQYDEPENSFENIARFWSVYLDVEITQADVCAMMSLLKLARIKYNPGHDDNWIDLAGYAACGYEVK